MTTMALIAMTAMLITLLFIVSGMKMMASTAKVAISTNRLNHQYADREARPR